MINRKIVSLENFLYVFVEVRMFNDIRAVFG